MAQPLWCAASLWLAERCFMI